MNPLRYRLPAALVAILLVAAALHGPIAQFPNYHDFADQETRFGIAHFADVVSNMGFALVALWGWRQLAAFAQHDAMSMGWAGYRLFLFGLLLTTIGSSWYHLAPDNARLVWDRIPIALACAGLIAGVWGDTHARDSRKLAAWLALAAVASVAWWHLGERTGSGDLRPYLLLQVLPLLLIPLWQWLYRRSDAERMGFAAALAIYAIAKFAEVRDHAIAGALGGVSGHTLKHLLASVSAALIIACLVRRVRRSGRRAGDREKKFQLSFRESGE